MGSKSQIKTKLQQKLAALISRREARSEDDLSMDGSSGRQNETDPLRLCAGIWRRAICGRRNSHATAKAQTIV